ncbi:uncharacterized protein [Macrobrachium rosenbergii]|uniref:uncharacterized protein n=1 Tax=Macrobrachium rosenbergii TaxID=79674 RepID=UPI0034D6E630
MPRETSFTEMTFGARNFNNHEILSIPHKNEEPNHSLAHCYSSTQLEDANFYEDWDAEDQAVFKVEEFEDESEMKYQSVTGCKLHSKLPSDNKTEYSDEVPNYKDNATSVRVPKFQSPSKETKNNASIRRLSLGRIPNHVKCFCCERYIKESHFSEHLLFGEVRCSVCERYFSDCQSFMGDIKVCDHTLVFTTDPLTYIAGKLSLVEADRCLVNEGLLNELEKYIYKIRSLESRLPWQHAIDKCKEHLALEKSKKINADNDRLGHSDHLIPANEYKSIEDIRSFTELHSVCLTNTFQEGDQMVNGGRDSSFAQKEEMQFYELTREAETNQPSACYKDKDYFVNFQDLAYTNSTEMASCVSPQGSCNKVTNHQFLDNTQFSGIPAINKETIPVDTPSTKTGHETDRCGTVSTPVARPNTANGHLKEKHVSFKKQKKKPMPLSKKKVSKTNTLMNLVAQPSDGFYYITKTPIEECPNCYCMLCPLACTVNYRTFLITFNCPDCSLVIYIANDDIDIITEKEGKSLKNCLPGESRKRISKSKSCSRKKSSLLTNNPFIRK